MEIPLLTSGESKVYQALIELGETSVGNILKFSSVSHSKIYDILKRLSNKGLVSSINKNGRQYFSAANPKQLKNLITKEEQELAKNKKQIMQMIKKLKVRQNISKPTSVLNSYEGINGMKTVLEFVLDNIEKGEEILILGSPKKIGNQAGGYLKEWQQKRIKLKNKCKIITDLDSSSWEENWWKKSKKNKLTYTKKSSSISPAYFVITKNLVVTIYFSDIIISIYVDHKEIAKKYCDFFDIIWKA
ncbi:hypothetical protein HN385_00215 [archaeon]|jgi:HTH-type transcriptional regulator, sugar sensing transcriptional regulator|nr:hypothetical protein [archaeon]MBT5021672.1 hypothetical protein [Candidatus Woesearchaeota archaeon]MBT3451653.1 hypothetical protein [archaeon]MBT6869674.1 hypothetical protein [archaeon]MBT7192442.1 hypothetical protein [archaeon]